MRRADSMTEQPDSQPLSSLITRDFRRNVAAIESTLAPLRPHPGKHTLPCPFDAAAVLTVTIDDSGKAKALCSSKGCINWIE